MDPRIRHCRHEGPTCTDLTVSSLHQLEELAAEMQAPASSPELPRLLPRLLPRRVCNKAVEVVRVALSERLRTAAACSDPIAGRRGEERTEDCTEPTDGVRRASSMSRMSRVGLD